MNRRLPLWLFWLAWLLVAALPATAGPIAMGLSRRRCCRPRSTRRAFAAQGQGLLSSQAGPLRGRVPIVCMSHKRGIIKAVNLAGRKDVAC
jgi:hypothetical protein